MGFDLRQLRYFQAVAEELHFGRAARRLHITQPSLSQQISALERTVGAPLLERSPRGVRLTSAGSALLPEARALVARADQSLRTVRRLAAGLRPTLHVGLSPGIGPALLRRVRTAALRVGADVTVRDASTAEQVDLLGRRELDLGLLLEPVEDDRLELLRLADEPLGVITGRHHELPPEVTPQDLTDRRLLWFPRQDAPGYHDEVLSRCAAAGWEPQVSTTGTTRLSAIVLLLTTEADLVSLVPAEKAGHPELLWRPLRDAPRHRIALARHRDNRADPVHRLRAALGA
jgi:DNA-binding transcriptional LysR family regulator